MDRYIACLGLQLVPDVSAMLREARRVLTTDGIAGFVIWGRPEKSGIYSVCGRANAELNIEGGGEHPYFALSKDLPALRRQFKDAGFSRMRLWPYQSAVECWSGEEFAHFLDGLRPVADEAARPRRFELAKQMADEWLEANEFPLGLEVYIIVAKP